MNDEVSRNPLKLFIQDIFRAQETSNKYVYKIFDQPFKNIKIHGVITAVYNNNGSTTNIELSDPTGTVQIYYDSRKNNSNISDSCMKDLRFGFEKSSRFNDPNIQIMNKLMERVSGKFKNRTDFAEGQFLCVIGDIFIDDLRDVRMISAYQCTLSSVENDLIWLNELNFIYEKYYFPKLLNENPKS